MCANVNAEAAADPFHPDAPVLVQFKLAHARKRRSRAAGDRQSSIGIVQSISSNDLSVIVDRQYSPVIVRVIIVVIAIAWSEWSAVSDNSRGSGNLSQFGARVRLNSVWFDSRERTSRPLQQNGRQSPIVVGQARSDWFREWFWECFYCEKRIRNFIARINEEEWYRISKEQIRRRIKILHSRSLNVGGGNMSTEEKFNAAVNVIKNLPKNGNLSRGIYLSQIIGEEKTPPENRTHTDIFKTSIF